MLTITVSGFPSLPAMTVVFGDSIIRVTNNGHTPAKIVLMAPPRVRCRLCNTWLPEELNMAMKLGWSGHCCPNCVEEQSKICLQNCGRLPKSNREFFCNSCHKIHPHSQRTPYRQNRNTCHNSYKTHKRVYRQRKVAGERRVCQTTP